MKLKCPKCDSFEWIEGDSELDCDRGLYIIQCFCTCGECFTITFKADNIELVEAN